MTHRGETRLRRKRGSLTPSARTSPRGHAKEVAIAVGGVCKRLLDRERRARLILGPDVGEIEGMSRRFDVRKIELGDLANRFENRVQLLLETLDLLLGQIKPRELRYVQNLISRNRHHRILPKVQPDSDTQTVAGGAGLRPAGAQPPVAVSPTRRRGPTGEPWVPPS